ncbi:UDP-glucuronosyltransferase 2B9-like isoform X3 [Sipha flava]|nr:UDP-glucuronosyltransferase 2B9-like isoform X3 [Sipha flava]
MMGGRWIAVITTTVLLYTARDRGHVTATGYNILAIFPFSGKSHFYMFRAISQALVARGHDVTVVSHFPETLSSPKQQQRRDSATNGSYTDYSLAGSVPVYENFTTDELIGNGYLEEFLIILQDGVDNCEGVMSSGRLDELVRNRVRFDLVLVEVFNTGCFALVANQFGAPIIGITSTSLYPWYSGMVGDVATPSYVPLNLLPFTSRMTVKERLINTVILMTLKIYYKYKYEPKAQEIVNKYLGDMNGTVSEAMSMINAVIMNTHFAFGFARPLPPGIIEVGGCTYKSPKPLSEDLERFVTSAERGVIYFSMGSIIKGASMPMERSLAMFRAFSQLKGYKVLWKWEDDTPWPEVPSDNVMFVPWMPQFDVLNHPNVKLFISHGGLMGIQDALYSGVPIIGIPMFADQFSNINFIVQNECGLKLQLEQIDERTAYKMISTVLEDNK